MLRRITNATPTGNKLTIVRPGLLSLPRWIHNSPAPPTTNVRQSVAVPRGTGDVSSVSKSTKSEPPAQQFEYEYDMIWIEHQRSKHKEDYSAGFYRGDWTLPRFPLSWEEQ